MPRMESCSMKLGGVISSDLLGSNRNVLESRKSVSENSPCPADWLSLCRGGVGE